MIDKIKDLVSDIWYEHDKKICIALVIVLLFFIIG